MSFNPITAVLPALDTQSLVDVNFIVRDNKLYAILRDGTELDPMSCPPGRDGQDGQDGKNGNCTFIASGRTGGDDHGYFRDSDLQEPIIGEIHEGDFILLTLNGCLYKITEITTERNVKHYRYTVPGIPLRGEDGYSPNITVKKSTDTEYILTITNKNGSYDTPNLKPSESVTKDYVDEAIRRLESLIDKKQPKLVAGNNISIINNVISATGVVVNPTEPQEQPQSNEPVFKLFSAPKTSDSQSESPDIVVEETHDTENNLIDRDENLYVQFNDGEPEPDLSIVDDDLHLNTEQDLNMYINDDGDLILETEE